MAIINDLKMLVMRSKLFMDADKLEKLKDKKPSRRGKNDIKIGQGGTLDPLADGVLGDPNRHVGVFELTRTTSGWRWESYEKVVAVSGMHQGS
jgi:hypothetical protein